MAWLKASNAACHRFALAWALPCAIHFLSAGAVFLLGAAEEGVAAGLPNGNEDSGFELEQAERPIENNNAVAIHNLPVTGLFSGLGKNVRTPLSPFIFQNPSGFIVNFCGRFGKGMRQGFIYLQQRHWGKNGGRLLAFLSCVFALL